MADITPLPEPGQEPWNLNPALLAINAETEANTDAIDDLEGDISELASDISSLNSWRTTGSKLDFLATGDGQRYQLVSGCLRNEGSGWTVLENSGHHTLNVDSVTQNSGAILVDYSSMGVNKIVSFVTAPDQVLAAEGIMSGASVGGSIAQIRLSKVNALSDLVYYNGTNWVSSNGVYTVSDWSGGVLTLTHLPLSTSRPYPVALTPRGGTYNVVASSGSNAVSQTQVRIEFWSNGSSPARVTTANTNMQVYITRPGPGGTLNPADVNTTTYPLSNIWFIGVMQVS